LLSPAFTQKNEGGAGQQVQRDDDRAGSGSGDGPTGIDPIIAGLLKRLPKSGNVWPEAERKALA